MPLSRNVPPGSTSSHSGIPSVGDVFSDPGIAGGDETSSSSTGNRQG
ncbi:hypothetical protein [Photorhabdus luminescens]|nr:hypothetical protein [Photorhabdus luminescens]